MLHITGNVANGDSEMSVLERQRARMKWQQEEFQQQQMLSYFDGQSDHMNSFPQGAEAHKFHGLINVNDQSLNEIVTRAIKPDPCLENNWGDFEAIGTDGFGYVPDGVGHGMSHTTDMNHAISRTTSCPPTTADSVVNASDVKETVLSSNRGKESFKKRKADKNQQLKDVAEEETKVKKMKESIEEGGSKVSTEGNSNKRSKHNSNNSKETSDTSKEKSKITEEKKPDYIHVRARRGQATDSHSLAERVRREKISERMRFLQDLVPGCNKITGKAGMLDEIINYVQSLQRQVEFLSMKLAAVNPRIDIDIDNIFNKEIIAASTSNFPTVGAGTSSEMLSLAHRQFSSLQQIVSSSGLDMGILNLSEMALRRSTSTPVSIPETFLDSSSINQVQSFQTWDTELNNLYAMDLQQGRSVQFLPHQFTEMASFEMKYSHWVEEQQKKNTELGNVLQSPRSEMELKLLVENVLSHYYDLFRMKADAAKVDVFYVMSGMWRTSLERLYLWLGGFRPSDLINVVMTQVEPLTDQQIIRVCNLLHCCHQAEDALTQGMDKVQQSLTQNILNMTTEAGSYNSRMLSYKEILEVLASFINQADHLRQLTLGEMSRILTTRQAARGLLAFGEYHQRLRALSSLKAAWPREPT